MRERERERERERPRPQPPTRAEERERERAKSDTSLPGASHLCFTGEEENRKASYIHHHHHHHCTTTTTITTPPPPPPLPYARLTTAKPTKISEWLERGGWNGVKPREVGRRRVTGRYDWSVWCGVDRRPRGGLRGQTAATITISCPGFTPRGLYQPLCQS